jgi:hypothetical protein
MVLNELVKALWNQRGAAAQTIYGLAKMSAGSSLRYWGINNGVEIPIIPEYLSSTGIIDSVGGVVRIVRQSRPNRVRTVETWLIGNRRYLAEALRTGRQTYRNSKAFDRRFSGNIVQGYTLDQYLNGIGLHNNDVVTVPINTTNIISSNPEAALREAIYRSLPPDLRRVSDLNGRLPNELRQNPRLVPAYVSQGQTITPMGDQYLVNALGNVIVPRILIPIGH